MMNDLCVHVGGLVRQTARDLERLTFQIKPVPPFRLDLTVQARRRAINAVDRWDGTTYRRILIMDGWRVGIEVVQIAPSERPMLQVTVSGSSLPPSARFAAMAALTRLLGVDRCLDDFYRAAADHPGLGRFPRPRRGGFHGRSQGRKARRHRRTGRDDAEGGAPKMSSKTAGIPRYRAFAGPALLRQGFRPFFLGAGIWAAAATLLWISALQGHVAIPTAFDPIGWHAHEMLFGFVVAAIAGFLLTAIPNWTGRMPLQGLPLAALAAVWLTGRAAVFGSAWIGSGVAAALDLSFLAALLAVVLREILAGRNWRNLPMPVVLGGLLAANALTHADTIGLAATSPLGQRLGIAIVILLMSLVGGRIIPSFTLNWLKKRGESNLPASFGALDRGALGLAAAALAIWVIAPESPIGGAALIAAGLASLIRLARWRGHLTLAEPLVWSLHLGFVWTPIGLLLIGVGAFLPDVPPAAGLHALTAGAMGGMTLAVMTRATLGHTGRSLTADRWTAAIYLLVAAAAVLRVAAPFSADVYLPLLWFSGLAWSAAFGLFVVHYGRMLSR